MSCDMGVGVTCGSCEAVCGLSVSGSGIPAWIPALTGVDAVVVVVGPAVVGSGSFSVKRGNREGEGKGGGELLHQKGHQETTKLIRISFIY